MCAGKLVRCKFCDWARPVWSRSRGRRVSGWVVLREHVESAHPAEYEAIQDAIKPGRVSVREYVRRAIQTRPPSSVGFMVNRRPPSAATGRPSSRDRRSRRSRSRRGAK